MRRLVSLVLLLIFGLPMVAPVLGLGSEEAALPACCRRAGAHHCMGGMQGETGAAWRAPKCSAYPVAAVAIGHGDVGVVADALGVGGVPSQPTARARAMTRARVAREKARGTRGPPVAA